MRFRRPTYECGACALHYPLAGGYLFPHPTKDALVCMTCWHYYVAIQSTRIGKPGLAITFTEGL